MARRVVQAAAEGEAVRPEERYVLRAVRAALVEFLNDLTLAKETLGDEGLRRMRVDRTDEEGEEDGREHAGETDNLVNFHGMNYLNRASSIPCPGDVVAVVRRRDLLRCSQGGEGAPLLRTGAVTALAVVEATFPAPLEVLVDVADELVIFKKKNVLNCLK